MPQGGYRKSPARLVVMTLYKCSYIFITELEGYIYLLKTFKLEGKVSIISGAFYCFYALFYRHDTVTCYSTSYVRTTTGGYPAVTGITCFT